MSARGRTCATHYDLRLPIFNWRNEMGPRALRKEFPGSLPVELLSNFGRITPTRGTTSAPATINSVATRKRPRPANRRYATNRALSWRTTICNTLARWRRAWPSRATRHSAADHFPLAIVGTIKNALQERQKEFRESRRTQHPTDNEPQGTVGKSRSR